MFLAEPRIIKNNKNILKMVSYLIKKFQLRVKLLENFKFFKGNELLNTLGPFKSRKQQIKREKRKQSVC